jgi:hypothetical protein
MIIDLYAHCAQFLHYYYLFAQEQKKQHITVKITDDHVKVRGSTASQIWIGKQLQM